MDVGLIAALLIVFAVGYLLGRSHSGGARMDAGQRRQWRMRADNNVTRHQPARHRSAAAGPARKHAPASTARRKGFGGFMDAINIETLVGSLPGATQQQILDGDRAGAARSLQAAYPTLSPHVIKDTVDAWAARNGA